MRQLDKIQSAPDQLAKEITELRRQLAVAAAKDTDPTAHRRLICIRNVVRLYLYSEGFFLADTRTAASRWVSCPDTDIQQLVLLYLKDERVPTRRLITQVTETEYVLLYQENRDVSPLYKVAVQSLDQGISLGEAVIAVFNDVTEAYYSLVNARGEQSDY